MTNTAKAFYHEMVDRVEAFQVTDSLRDQIEVITELRNELTRKLSVLRTQTRSAGNVDAAE